MMLETIAALSNVLGLIPPLDIPIFPMEGGIPNPDPAQPPGTGGITTIIGWLKWIGLAVAGGAVIVAGIIIAVSMRRGEGAFAATNLLYPLAGVIVISGGIGLISLVSGV